MRKQIVFFAAAMAVVFIVASQPTTGLSGKVTDQDLRPVAGATVIILNTEIAALTDEQGTFTFKNLPAGSYTVLISASGFAAVNKTITAGQHAAVDIRLQPSALQLDEVIVSAQKKEERLQSLPFSISALTAGKVQDYRLWNTKDITAIVPNLYAANPGDDRNVSSIRGITTTSYDPAVATYVDGVNQFSLDTYIPQLFDVERIEVLRGPQGTLYGRNAMGGVINVITRKPRNYVNGFAEATVGNYGRHRYSAGIRMPLIKDKLYAGAAGMFNAFSGFYTNEMDNSDFDRQHAVTGNYYLTYIATPRLSVTLNARHNNNRNHGPFTLVNGTDAAFDNPFKLTQNATSKMVDNTFNSSLSVNYNGAAVSFTSQTAWQNNHRYYTDPLDGDFSPIDGVTIINNYGRRWNNVKVFTQEFRLGSSLTSASPLSWTSGVYLFHQSAPNKQATHFGEDADMLGSPDKNFSLINTSTGKNAGAAVYGQASYAVTPKLTITGGLRYDYEHKKMSVLGEYQPDGSPDPVFETQPDTSATASFNAFSPRLSVAYAISPAHNLYATYSRGFRAGGLTQLSTDPGSAPPLYPFDPEYSNNYEIGIKNIFPGNRVLLNLALFYANITDAQVPTLVLPDAVTLTRNAGRLNTRGAEVEITARPAKGLDIDYNFGYTDAKYKTLKLSQNGSEENYDGNRQVFTPSTTSSLAAQYSAGIGSRKAAELVVRMEWMAVGRHYFDLANNIEQKGYSLLNTKFGVRLKQADIMCWMRNIADERYLSYAYDFGAVQMGAPRTFGITVAARF